jgi:hypothetical protein
MSGHTPWNEVRWAMANARLGLARDEICPGLSVDDHAESIAMYDMHGIPVNNKVWQLAVKSCAKLVKDRLIKPVAKHQNDETA